MKRLFVLFLFGSFLLAGELKIATFNVENLFDGLNNGNEYIDFKIGSSNWNHEKYIKKLNNISKVLQDIDADIIALQEIENDEVMRRLAEKSGYKYYKFTKSKTSPIGLGVLSKINIEDYQIYRPERIKTRDILRVDFKFEDEEFSLFICHFPSAKNTFRDRKTMSNLLKKVLKDSKNAIALGDFNSEYGEKSLLNDIIRVEKFVDLWKFLPVNKRSSHISSRPIDHIILSPELFNSAGLNYKKNSFAVYRPSLIKNIFSAKSSYSDHYPIYFTLNTEPYDADLKSVSIDEIYAKNGNMQDVKLEKAVVIYKDKNGFVVSQTGRGIYIHERDLNNVILGSMVDIKVYGVHEYKENLEINSFEIVKIHDEAVDIKRYMLPQEKLKFAKSGDVIPSISGDVKNGILKSKFGNIRVYRAKNRDEDGINQTFTNVLVRNHNNETELVLQDFK